MSETNALVRALTVLEARLPAAESTAERLARASEASHPRQALAVYLKRVDDLVERGDYPAAVDLTDRMAGLRPVAEQAAYLADLRRRHARKRSLLKLLA